MKTKNASKKVMRIPLIVPIIIIAAIALIMASFLGTQLITNAARFTATNALTTADANFEYMELDDGTIEISKYAGTDTIVIVPDIIDGKDVTSIGDSAFQFCSKIIEITIPEGVNNIGEGAFWCCENLTEIIIPEEVTNIGDYAFGHCENLIEISIPKKVTNIGYESFMGCADLVKINVATDNETYISENGILFNKEKSELIHYPAQKTDTKYIIPEGVKRLEGYAFENCSNLTEITIPEGLTYMGEYVFKGCKSLSSMTITDEIYSISYGAFYDCTSLRSIDIPQSVWNISSFAFKNCISLTTINISEKVQYINEGAFYGCTKLSTIEIPIKVRVIGKMAFHNCTNLKSINVAKDNSNYMSENGVLFNKEQTEIIKYPEGKQETVYQIPKTVTSIGNRAFSNCTSLRNIIFPEALTSIGEYGYSGCTNLTNINIPNNTTNIGASAFRECVSLVSINIPEGVTDIKNALFYGCTNLCNVSLPTTVTIIEGAAFSNCTNLCNIEMPDGVTSIGGWAFSSCKNLSKIKIPASVTNINEYAFYRCTNLENLEIEAIEASIKENSFKEARIIKTINMEGTTTEEIELPNVIKRTMDENDILYNSGEFTMTNCSLNEDNSKLVVDIGIAKQKNAKLYVKKGALMGLSVVIVVPSGTITYSTTEKTKNSVTATLYIDEGETITNNNGENTYVFKENGEFLFEYTNTEGKVQTARSVVDWIYEIKSEKYNIEDSYISQIQPQTTVKDFKANIQTNATEVNIYGNDGEQLKDSDIVATGMQIKVIFGEVKEIYTLIIKGDSNGDGTVDFKDLVKINSHRLNKNQIEGEYLLAADVNEDGVADFKDMVKINKFRLHKSTEL